MNAEKLEQVRQAIALLDSMIKSGERHSAESERAVADARSIVREASVAELHERHATAEVRVALAIDEVGCVAVRGSNCGGVEHQARYAREALPKSREPRRSIVREIYLRVPKLEIVDVFEPKLKITDTGESWQDVADQARPRRYFSEGQLELTADEVYDLRGLIEVLRVVGHTEASKRFFGWWLSSTGSLSDLASRLEDAINPEEVT